MDEMKIRNETNPYLREIWAEGYTHVSDEPDGLRLYKDGSLAKFIDRGALMGVVMGVMTKTARLYDGTLHTWIAEADGSADRFRQLIALPPNQRQ